MKIVATTSLPAVDRPNADRWNAARSRQKKKKEMTDVYSGHYVIASIRPPERWLLERRTLVPIDGKLPQLGLSDEVRQNFPAQMLHPVFISKLCLGTTE